MIRYTLACDDGHTFESWFQSASAYDGLKSAGKLTCAICGSLNVEKTIMAPAVNSTKALTQDKKSPLEELREKVEANADYVGTDFATEARAMHDGDKPERAIYGEAKMQDARALVEDGVPVMPLPFTSRKQVN